MTGRNNKKRQRYPLDDREQDEETRSDLTRHYWHIPSMTKKKPREQQGPRFLRAQVDRFSQTLSEMKHDHSLIPRSEQSICPPFVIKHLGF